MTYRGLMAKLEAYIATMDIPPPYWLRGGNSESSYVYCRACADKAAEADPDAEIDGGWSGEEDTGLRCETCGKLLMYQLTDYGFSSEVDHYQENPPTSPLSQEEAFHIERLLCAASEDNAAALKIAEQAVEAMP